LSIIEFENEMLWTFLSNTLWHYL